MMYIVVTRCIWSTDSLGSTASTLVNMLFVIYFNLVMFVWFRNIGFFMSSLVFSVLTMTSFHLGWVEWIALTSFMVVLLVVDPFQKISSPFCSLSWLLLQTVLFSFVAWSAWHHNPPDLRLSPSQWLILCISQWISNCPGWAWGFY